MLIQRARNNTDFREKKKFCFFLKRSCGVRWCFSFSVSVFAISRLPPPPPSDADSRVSFLFWDFAHFFFSHTILATDSFREIKFWSGFLAIPTRISKKQPSVQSKQFLLNPSQHFSLSHKRWAFVFYADTFVLFLKSPLAVSFSGKTPSGGQACIFSPSSERSDSLSAYISEEEEEEEERLF